MGSRLSASAGLAIRKLRLAKGWTLSQLGDRAGVPLSTLSKVELGQTSLSYENLLRICRGLEVEMERLVDAEADGKVAPPPPPGGRRRRAVARSGQGEPTRLPAGVGHVIGADLLHKSFTPVIVEVTAEDLDSHGGFQRDEGEAFVMVLEGALAIHSEHHAALRLQAGDGIYFDARCGYAILRDGPAPCRALLVFSGDRRA